MKKEGTGKTKKNGQRNKKRNDQIKSKSFSSDKKT